MLSPAIREDLGDTVLSLLDDIADAKDRLSLAIQETRDEHDRLREAHVKFQAISQRIYDTIWDSSVPPERHKRRQSDLVDKLTSREIEVLRLLVEGQSTKEIAATLNIAFKTAVCHRSHVLEKLKCHETASVVRIAVQSGLLDIESPPPGLGRSA